MGRRCGTIGVSKGKGSLSRKQEIPYNVYDFAKLQNYPYRYEKGNRYFTRIHNAFIQKSLYKEYGLHRIFLMVYITIDRHRTYEDYSYLSVGQILQICGYKCRKTKPKIFYEVLRSLLFLKENYFIETSFDIYGISYNDIISVKIIRQNFDPIGNYTKLYGDDLDRILNIGTTLNKESLLVVFLYIASYIGCRKRQSDGSDYPGAQDHPEAFWKSLDGMAKELSMSKDTINQSIDYLVTPSDLNAALLIKKEVGSIRADQGKVLKNVPNIYVLNKEGYQQEIQWALDKMCETYRVDEFHSVIGTEQRKDNEEC